MVYDLRVQKEEVMKSLTTFSLILLVLCLSSSALAQKEPENLIKNGNFEKFTGDNPDNWGTSNIPGTLIVVSPSKTCYTGVRAIKCEVKDFFGSVVAGYIAQKNLQTNGKDLKLSGYFNVHSVSKDQGVVVLTFQNLNGSTVGSVEEYLEDTKSQFVLLEKEIKAPAGAMTVGISITILPGKESEKAHPGSNLICDDLKMATFVLPEKPLIQ